MTTPPESSQPGEEITSATEDGKKKWKLKDYLGLGGLALTGTAAIAAFGIFFAEPCTYLYTQFIQPNADYSESSKYRKNLERRIAEVEELEPRRFSFRKSLLDSVREPPASDDKNSYSSFSSIPGLRGSSFYVQRSPDEFSLRVKQWLAFLGAGNLLPNIDNITALEVGNILQQMGESRLYGQASPSVNTILFRPGDYSTFIHEVKHLNGEDNDTALAGEAGSYAMQVFTTGEYAVAESALGSGAYRDSDKQLIRYLTEAVFVGGSETFAWLQEYDKTKYSPLEGKWEISSPADLLHHLQRRIDEFKERILASSMTPQQYLIGFHKIPKEVADEILSTTGDDLESVIAGTNGTKKKMISAFRALTSFYFINLGYPLNQSVGKTLVHFQKKEALTIAETLWDGAKEVYARFKEYNVPFEVQRKFVEKMLSSGIDSAKSSAEKLPRVLDFTANFGKNGWKLIDLMIEDPGFQEVLCYLDDYYKKDPSRTTEIAKNILSGTVPHNLCSHIPDYLSYKMEECIPKFLTFP